jgi:hypothetical protein
MAIDQQTINIKGRFKSNRRWLIASIVAGLLPFSFDIFQDLIPGFLFFGSPILAVILVYILPIAVCVLATIKLYKWWKLVPIVMLIFNVLYILFLIAFYMWLRSGGFYM